MKSQTLSRSHSILPGTDDSWCLAGYQPPKTCLFLTRYVGNPTEVRKNFTDEFAKKYIQNDPGKTSDPEKDFKRNWLNSSGQFSKLDRETHTAKIMRKSASTPGPGFYFQEDKSRKRKLDIKLGKFSKCERGSFLDNIQAMGQDVPSSWKYTPFDSKKKKFTNPIYHKPYHITVVKKNNPGPGLNHESVEKALKKQVFRSSHVFVIPKEKRINFTQVLAKRKEGIPGVSTYEGASLYDTISKRAEKNTFSKELQEIKKKNYNFVRVSEAESKAKSWIPGVGTYNLIPKRKDFNK